MKVYIVGWSGKTYSEIFGVFKNLEDAEKSRNKLRSELCPSAITRDDSWVLERELHESSIIDCRDDGKVACLPRSLDGCESSSPAFLRS
jgi:hypothetical protein